MGLCSSGKMPWTTIISTYTELSTSHTKRYERVLLLFSIEQRYRLLSSSKMIQVNDIGKHIGIALEKVAETFFLMTF